MSTFISVKEYNPPILLIDIAESLPSIKDFAREHFLATLNENPRIFNDFSPRVPSLDYLLDSSGLIIDESNNTAVIGALLMTTPGGTYLKPGSKPDTYFLEEGIRFSGQVLARPFVFPLELAASNKLASALKCQKIYNLIVPADVETLIPQIYATIDAFAQKHS